MAVINPYLNFNGNTEEAFLFYKSVFGGEFTTFQRISDMPSVPGMPTFPESEQDKVMHVALPIGANTLMGTDVIESMGHPKAEGNNISISITTETEEETKRLFNALSEGAEITMPLEKVFWGPLYGMLKDKFGIQWMVNLVPVK